MSASEMHLNMFELESDWKKNDTTTQTKHGKTLENKSMEHVAYMFMEM